MSAVSFPKRSHPLPPGFLQEPGGAVFFLIAYPVHRLSKKDLHSGGRTERVIGIIFESMTQEETM
jgi:hypothetical protein